MVSLQPRLKIGFIGAGNMAQAMIKGMVQSGKVSPAKIFVSSRTSQKPQKLRDLYNIQVCRNNEEVVETCDVIILAMKPQDFAPALEPVASLFTDKQIVISLAAGLRLETLEKVLPQTRLVRLMPNTPSLIQKGSIGCLVNDDQDSSLNDLMEDLFSCLGSVYQIETEEQFESFMIACSSGTGFVYELMMYWQDWLEEHGFDSASARRMTQEVFMGAAMMAQQNIDQGLEELQGKVTSKKGVTAAGLESMRELEIERALRISFEKADLRNKEINRQMKST
ncbi:MAG: pyrroline-5-carboxylate reductase family protein [Bdellovibrionales bacterium]